MNGFKRNNLFPIPALILVSVLAGGCLIPGRPGTEPALQSGFDAEGRPIAFKILPKSRTGDIDWVAAVRSGAISPKSSLDPSGEVRDDVLDLDVVFNIGTGYPLPHVVFPHAPHTVWLSCNNCHPVFFKMARGGNPVSMDSVVRGEFCGRCHGKVAFPISDCLRCHSLPKEGPAAEPGHPETEKTRG